MEDPGEFCLQKYSYDFQNKTLDIIITVLA